MRVEVTTPPAEEPISLTEAKLHLKVELEEDDDLITTLIVAARGKAESLTRRSLVTQTRKLYLDAWPSKGTIKIPWPPLQSISSVSYYASSGSLTTLASSSYHTSVGDGGRVVLADGQAWPDLQVARPDAVIVEYVAGYGDADDIPAAIKAGMKLLIGHWYKQREDAISGTIINTIPSGAKSLFDTVLWGHCS